MITIRNQKHFDAVVDFAKTHGLYEPDPKKPDLHSLRRALDRLESFCRKGPSGQPTTRVVLVPDGAPHSFGFSVEAAVDEGWEATLVGGVIFHGPHDGFGNGSAPTFCVSLTPVVGWTLHT
jgi:hypothetical protein